MAHYRHRESSVSECLANRPVAVEEHLPVVVVVAVDFEGDNRPGELDRADRGAGRRLDDHVGDLPTQVFQQSDGLPVIHTATPMATPTAASSAAKAVVWMPKTPSTTKMRSTFRVRLTTVTT
jgi:hypothetical protein